jgi:hypothetical protein
MAPFTLTLKHLGAVRANLLIVVGIIVASTGGSAAVPILCSGRFPSLFVR